MKTTNNKKSKFLALLLSAMIFSSMGAAFAACTDNADSSSSSSSSSTEDTTNDKVDNGTIKNSNFDFTNLTDTVKIGTSVTGWSRAVNSVTTGSAPSSKSASGVVDTKTEKWNDLTTRNKTDEDIAAMEIKDAVAAWDSMTTADKLAFYKDWKAREKNKDLDIDDEFEEYKKDSYQSFNVKYEDLPIDTETSEALANPETPAGATDTQILMIHNNTGSKDSSGNYSAGTGTAQKYTSSSTVTVPAGTAAQVSVWVKTANLKTVDTNKEEQDAVGQGAYISVTQTVGGKSLDSFEVKNIQTDEWKQYTFYLKGSSFADTKFSIVLGLGQNGGSDHFGYVNGYAFFDNVEYKELTLDEYDTATNGITAVGLGAEKADKTIDTYSNDQTKFAMDFHNAYWADFSATVSTTAKVTESTDGSTYNTELSDSTIDVMKYAAKSDFANSSDNKYLESVYNNFLTSDADDAFLQNNDKLLMMLSASGAAYTWEKAYNFTLEKDYMAISFYVKTSDFGQGTGLTITLANDESSTSFSSINTAIIEDIEETNDGWQRYFFFVEKDEDLKGSTATQDFYLTLNYGATSINVSTAKTSYTPGFAALTKFETLEMDKLEYSCAEAGDYAQLHTLVATEEEKATGNAGFDSAAGTPSDALENGLADAQNYKGVYSDSYYVNPGSESTNGYRINANENAGLLNREKFIENYATIIANPDNATWVNALGLTASTDPEEAWNSIFGNATQPLFILNDGSNAYGYIGTSTTLSASYTLVSVRVKTVNATASVYLVDMDDATRQSMLTISDNLVYWYDDNGNILTGDPDEKTSKVAFRLNKKTGLYKAEKDFSAYTGNYANLSAYAKDSDGNLIAAENSATHSYMDKDWDRIVYYYNAANNTYHTDKNFTADNEVKDLKSVTELKPRYEGGNSADLKIENVNTNGEWKTITFYIKKGNAAKNYRLEVWSGTRDGNTKNAANSYVLFDTNNPGTASSLYPALMEEYLEDEANIGTKFESVFSYYDTDRHVRYEEALDEDKVGNLYKDSFKASNYESAVAYMQYTADGNYTVFADYSLRDVTITPASADVDDDTDDDTDTDTNEDGMNIFMLISSIAVSAALLVAIGGIATQRIMKVVKRKKAAKAHVNVVKKNK